MPKVKDKVQTRASQIADNNWSSYLPFDLSLPGSRFGRQSGVDEAKDSIISTAQRAVDKARGTVGSALDQLPDSLPRRKQRHGPPKLLIVVIIAAAGAGAFFVYRWLNGGQSEDYGIDPSWPAQPDYGPKDEPRENDKQAEIDAEQALAARTGGAFGTPANPQSQP